MTPTSRLARDTSPQQVNSFVSRSRPALTLSNPRSPRRLSVRRRRSLSNTSPKCIDPRGLTRYHAGVPHELMSTGAEIETALNYRKIVCGVLDFRYDQSVSQLFHGHGPTPRSPGPPARNRQSGSAAPPGILPYGNGMISIMHISVSGQKCGPAHTFSSNKSAHKSSQVTTSSQVIQVKSLPNIFRQLLTHQNPLQKRACLCLHYALNPYASCRNHPTKHSRCRRVGVTSCHNDLLSNMTSSPLSGSTSSVAPPGTAAESSS